MCASIFAKKIHRARTQSIDARWKMTSPLTARSRGELIAGNHAPWRLWLSVGFHQPIYGDTTSTREMKGANINIPWIMGYIYIYMNINLIWLCLKFGDSNLWPQKKVGNDDLNRSIWEDLAAIR